MSLYIRESGPVDAPTIIFLHGGGISGWMWRPQVEELKQFHCLVPDLPEHGANIDITPFTIDGAAEQIIEIIRNKAHGGRAHIVGLSLGAQIALLVMSQAPEIIDHAILSGALTRPLIGTGPTRLWSRLVNPLKKYSFVRGMGMISVGIPGKYYVEYDEDWRTIPAESLERFNKEHLAFRMPVGLDQITIPTLAVLGEYEKLEVRETARDLVATLQDADGGVAPKCSLTWNLQEAKLFTKTVREWINDESKIDELMPLK